MKGVRLFGAVLALCLSVGIEAQAAIAVSNPLITAVQTAQQMAEAARDTDDPRMKALAAANVALAAQTAADAVSAGMDKENASVADQLGGIGINASIGSSKSQSRSTQTSDTAAGSNKLSCRMSASTKYGSRRAATAAATTCGQYARGNW